MPCVHDPLMWLMNKCHVHNVVIFMLSCVLNVNTPHFSIGDSTFHVHVSQSTLGGGTGLGLFSSILHQKKKGVELCLCGYGGSLVGDRITTTAKYDNDYTLFGAKGWSRNAKHESYHLGRYAQDPIAYSRCNAKFKRNYTDKSIRLIATRTIKEGEEIFVSYGTKYWLTVDNFGKLSRSHKRYMYNHSFGANKQWIKELVRK